MAEVKLTCKNTRNPDGSQIDYAIDSKLTPDNLSLLIIRPENGSSVFMACVEVCPVDGEYETKTISESAAIAMLAAGLRYAEWGDKPEASIDSGGLPISDTDVEGFAEELQRLSPSDLEATIAIEGDADIIQFGRFSR